MTRKITDTLGLFAFFAALFALTAPPRIQPQQYRDAPADFSYTSADEIRAQEVSLPEPVPAVDTSGGRAQVQNVAIYGENTLADYYKVDKSLQQLADSVVAFVKKTSLAYDEEAGTYSPLKVTMVGENRDFAASADFYDQRILAYCSGSLVAPDLVLTAGHCISNTPTDGSYLENVYVVFGWKQSGAGQYESTFTEDQVYEVDRIFVHKYEKELIGDIDRYQDYSLVRLNKPARGKTPLTLDRSGQFLVEGNKVFLAGYPMGMSVKVTDPDDASIKKIGRNNYLTDLDAFGGNSGGPVFDSYTRRLTGVLITANARQFKYTLSGDLSAELAVNRARDNSVTARDGVLTVSENILSGLTNELAKKGIILNNTAKTVTFPRGLVFYNNESLFGMIYALGGRTVSSGEPVRLPAFEGIGTGVQKINSVIEALTPLTAHERRVCAAISARMQANRPVIDPSLMMLYRSNRCDKELSI